tara:strand:- start:19 stop:228 length:210 start_codon:yes stop_codon:yes gene_type:complete
MSKSGYEFKLVDDGTLDTVIAVSGSDVRYTYSQECRNSFKTFDEFWAWVTGDIEKDIAENGLEEDLEGL